MARFLKHTSCMKYDTKEGGTKATVIQGPSSSKPVQGDIIAIPSRCISEKTAKLWNIESSGSDITYHYMKDGRSVAQHKRIATPTGKEMPCL